MRANTAHNYVFFGQLGSFFIRFYAAKIWILEHGISSSERAP